MSVEVIARACCSAANLGSGFDVIALALDAFYDEVKVHVVESTEPSVELVNISGPYSEGVSKELNTAVKAIEYFLKEKEVSTRVEVELWKGIPVGKGLGGSGASAAAAVKAISTALELEVSPEEAVRIAGFGEIVSAGTVHYDNVSASYLGGLAIVFSTDPLEVFSLKPGGDVEFILAIPKVATPPRKTEFMRKVLPKSIPLEKHVHNSGRLAALLIGFVNGDANIIGTGMRDAIVEPARAPYIPAYQRVKEYALEAGAKGVAVSGAGPSMIILAGKSSERICEAVRKAYEDEGIEVDLKVTKPAPGARIIKRSSF
ncbi:MAG: homoserine kinase [Thermoprotei archaeon]|nr:MAG: homoserine kinase [Thermoprotei archaeon]